MHEVLVNRLGGLSLPRKSVARLTDHPDMTLDVYRKTTMQQQQIYQDDARVIMKGCMQWNLVYIETISAPSRVLNPGLLDQ